MKKLTIKILLVLLLPTLLTFGLCKYIPNPVFEIQKANAFSARAVMMGAAGISGDGDGTSYAFPTGSLSVPNNANLDIGTSDFTIEGWVFSTNATNDFNIFDDWVGGGDQRAWQFSHNRNTGVWLLTTSSDGTTGGQVNLSWTKALVSSVWTHFEINRSGTSAILYIGGVGQGTQTAPSSIYAASNAMLVGEGLVGNLDEIRITIGSRRHTGDFTPSSIEHTSDADTQLLIHCGEDIDSGTTGSGATFTESGENGLTITETGSTIRDTSEYKF